MQDNVTASEWRAFFPAEITALSTGVYTLKEKVAGLSGSLTDANPGRIVKAYEINGKTVPTGTIVFAKFRHSKQGEPYYEFSAPDGTVGTVEELDGSPSYTAISTFRFDQTDGFVITNSDTGVVRVDIAPASFTQNGVMTTGNQSFDGIKNFQTIEINTVGTIQKDADNRFYVGDSGCGLQIIPAGLGVVLKQVSGAAAPYYAVKEDSGSVLTGVYGTMLDGSVVSGGIITTIGASSTALPDGDYGDVTVSSSGTVITVDSGVVTFAKMQAISANVLLGNDGAGSTVEEISCTAAGRAILDDADAAAQRTTLGLGTIATQAASSVSITGGSIVGATIDSTLAGTVKVPTPGDDDEAVPRVYLDDYPTFTEADAAYQAKDATLTALAGANWAANALPIGSGADTLSQVSFAANTFPARASIGNLVAKTITDFALTILDDADAAAVRATIGASAGVPTTITVADTTDSTCYVALFESATGDLAPKTDGSLIYDASTGTLAAVTFDGTATLVSVADAAGDASTWVLLATDQTGGQQPRTDSGLTYNANTNALAATTFSGALSGNASTATVLATARNIGGVSFDGSASIVPQTIESANEASDTTCFLLFITASGTQSLQPKNNTNLTFNASTGALGATSFVGSTAASTITGTTLASNVVTTSITSTGTLTGGATGSGFTVALDTSTITGTLALAQGGANADLSATGPGVLRQASAGANVTVGQALDYICLRDEKAQNTAGGTFTSGAWRTRTLNTEAADTGSNCSLSSNQFTLSAGTYRIRATAPAFDCSRHQAKLYNATDATDIIIGTSAVSVVAATADATISEIVGRFTVAASKALEIRHQCQTTRATDGMGVEANFTTEVYTVVELWKEIG